MVQAQTINKTTEIKKNNKTTTSSAFPSVRMRRGRRNQAMRDLLRETVLEPQNLILPVFVDEALDNRTEVSSMPGVFRETENSVVDIAKHAQQLGLGAIILFGVSHNKDNIGSDSMKAGGLLDRMVSKVRDACPDLLIIADLCFCEYTDHGHCGPLCETGIVDNDATIENIGKQAIIAAQAGADIVAPSGMMDGQVLSIRQALDQSGYKDTAIMAYAAKFASNFYGPFRDAAGCSLQKGDRKTYQMDPANGEEALREVALDLQEGADMVMVKPGLPYLDIIWRVKDTFKVPTFAYNVSGEYAMLRFAAQAGALDYNAALLEMLISFKRAGSDGILSYGAIEAAEILNA